MKKRDLINLIDESLIEKIYGFAYTRTSDSYEAQDLASDIIFELVKSSSSESENESEITEAYAYIYGKSLEMSMLITLKLVQIQITKCTYMTPTKFCQISKVMTAIFTAMKKIFMQN